MPYTVEKRSSCPAGKPWAVINQTNGSTVACHPTKTKAQAQQRALYANEPNLRRASIDAVTLSQNLKDAIAKVEERYLPALTAQYRAAILEAASVASSRFAITAAADWQPPVEGTLLSAAELARLASKMQTKLEPIWTRVVLDIPGEVMASIEISFDAQEPLVQSLIDRAGERVGARLGLATQHVLRQAVVEAYDQGMNVHDAAGLIKSKITDAAPWQADMLARTDLAAFSNGSSKMTAARVGMGYKTWLATLDDKTRPDHVVANGQTVPMNDTFTVGGEEADFPADPSLSDDQACNCRCVSPDTLVSGAIYAGLRRPYEGHLVRLITASGRNITVTPNHPVLTRRGWSAAGSLVEGDDLVCRARLKSPRTGPDIEHMPAEAHECYAALQLASTRRKRINAASMQLHGEIVESEIDVVWRADHLPAKRQSALAQHLLQLALILAEREMCTPSYLGALVGVTESKHIGAGAISRSQSFSSEHDCDRSSGNSIFLAEGQDARSGLEVFADIWDEQTLALVEGNGVRYGMRPSAAALLQMIPDGHGREALLASDLLVAHPTEVEADPVVYIRRLDFSGHVYNFSSDTGTFEADGIITANCTLVYGETLGEAEALLADSGRNNMSGMTVKQRSKRKARRVMASKPALVAGAVAIHHTGVVDGTWDGNAAMGKCSSAADFRSICAAYENNADLSLRQSWHLPHHANPNGPANINGVRNGLGRAPQTTSISPADRAGATAHLRAHLNDYNKRQGNNAIAGFDKMSNEDALAALERMLGPVDELAEGELAPAMPQGMDSLPTGVSHCSMRGTPGYTGGGICHMHDGTNAGMQGAIRKAQADTKKGSAAVTASARPVGFSGIATIEGKISDDNSIAPRVLCPNALTWQEMPVPFMAQTVTAEGHDGAEVAGRVDKFARKRATGGTYTISAQGELTTPFGINEIAPMIEDKTLRYVSADLGASVWALVDRKTLDVVPQEEFDIAKATDGAYALGLTSGKIKALTLVPTQAIEGAMVALTASAEEQGVGIEELGPEALMAITASGEYRPEPDRLIRVVLPISDLVSGGEAMVAAAAPRRPPRSWFETPEPPGKMPLTVLDDGRVYGHLATWDSCHASFLPSCVPPPRSPSNYGRFHTSYIDSADGGEINVGKLMFSGDGGHADRGLNAVRAAQYYDRTGMVAAVLRAQDGKFGIWVCGSLNPDLSDEQRAEMRRQLRLHPPSGDWRPYPDGYDLLCGLAVSVPGFGVPNEGVKMTIIASAEGVELQDALIASSGWFDADPAAVAALEQAGISDGEAEAEREMRVLAARAAGGMDAMAALIE